MRDAGFIAFRAPLLPFDTIVAWGSDLEAPQASADPGRLAEALARDRARVGARLRDLASRADVREALHVASPDLGRTLDRYLADPDRSADRSVQRSLVRYLTRMAARATPFGLCAGTAVGRFGTRTALMVHAATSCRRHTRLDMGYLARLAAAFERDPAIAATLRYQPNSSAIQHAARWLLVEARAGEKALTHHLVAVDESAPLRSALERAKGGATLAELAAGLIEPGIPMEDADAFVAELIDSQVLVSDLACPVTGGAPDQHISEVLDRSPTGRNAAAVLRAVAADLAAIDREGPGASPERYRDAAQRLEALPVTVDHSRLFQVDLVRAASATLGDDVRREIERGIDLLRRLTPRDDELSAFRAAFVERYAERQVPLLEALDEEAGVGSSLIAGGGRDASPLLRDLELPPAPATTIDWAPRLHAGMIARVGAVLVSGHTEIDLAAADIDELAAPEPAVLPGACAAMATVVAAGADACAHGRFEVLLHGVSGPSGAALLGRFCHADDELLTGVRAHLRDEEAADADAVFAEVVHLPQGRLGNILQRPVLREYEIVYLGRSGAPADRQIAAADLTLSVSHGRFVLRSRRLGRRVIPRLTSAHNFSNGSVGVYRLLCLLQADGCARGLRWDWGPLAWLPFLPRVRSGRVVLARAQWRVTGKEIRALAAGDDTRRYASVQAWRRDRNLPRWVVLADGDQLMPIDLDNVVAVDAFVALVEHREAAMLLELYPGPDGLCAVGGDGRYVHELIVPFTSGEAQERLRDSPAVGDALGVDRARLSDAPAAAAAHHQRPARPRKPPVRTFPPGSEWVYAKLYAGEAGADEILRRTVAPVSRAAVGSGDADRWFFIRYADPDPHVRWRIHGATNAAAGRVRREVERTIVELVTAGHVRRASMDTYEREVERYGGPSAIAAAEALFHADSEAVIDVLDALAGTGGDDARWQLALLGADALLADLGFELDARASLARAQREAFGREFRVDAETRRQLGRTARRVRPALVRVLDDPGSATGTLREGLTAFSRRAAEVRPIAVRLRHLHARRRLDVSMAEFAAGVTHMHLNRMLRAEARLHELVIYDLLASLYAERRMRSASSGSHLDTRLLGSEQQPRDQAGRSQDRAE